MRKSYQLLQASVVDIYKLRTFGQDNKSVLDVRLKIDDGKMVDGKWVGEKYYMTATFWDTLADNVLNTWKKYDQVIVWGTLKIKPEYTTKSGETRPPELAMSVVAAGHDNSKYPSVQDRPEFTPRDNSGSDEEDTSRPEKPAAKPKAKEEPKNNVIDDLDLDLDLDDDLDIDNLI